MLMRVSAQSSTENKFSISMITNVEMFYFMLYFILYTYRSIYNYQSSRLLFGGNGKADDNGGGGGGGRRLIGGHALNIFLL